MPRNNNKKAKKKKKALAAAKKQQQDVPTLVQRATHELERGQCEKASELLTQALQQQPEDTNIIDMAAEAFLQSGETSRAFQLLSQSAQLAPTANHTKWMYLGQLQQGNEALECFRRGLQVLGQKIEEEKKSGTENALRHMAYAASRAHIGICEIFMGDLCDEPSAETECEAAVQAALQTCSANPESHFVLANLRFIQQRGPEAKQALQSCLEVLARIQNQDNDNDNTDDMSWLLPSYESRSNMARLCMELGHFEGGVLVLERLLQENDTIIEHWYLLGVCYLQGQMFNEALQYLTVAKERFEKIMQHVTSDEEKAFYQTICEALAGAQEQAGSQPVGPLADGYVLGASSSSAQGGGGGSGGGMDTS